MCLSIYFVFVATFWYTFHVGMWRAHRMGRHHTATPPVLPEGCTSAAWNVTSEPSLNANTKSANTKSAIKSVSIIQSCRPEFAG